jgi:radical SAM superfamily enzyme YgiQ (UPF0313 family)
MSAVRTVLYVRLPCWKIYPGGVVYLADHVHKQRPEICQDILDLATVAAAARRQTLADRLRALKPDVVAFSWRNMQSFGPHPEDEALDIVLNFDHSPFWYRRLKAAFGAVSIISDYVSNRLRNFAYIDLARRLRPDARLVVGGSAVSIFARHIVEQCPKDTTVVVGEGEDAMLSIVDGAAEPRGEIYYKDHAGAVAHRCAGESFDLHRLTAVDFAYIDSIFPAFRQYLDGDVGVQTKRGCPFQCHFCLYNRIEGHRQRYRDPAEVAKEVDTLNKRYGVGRIWFTDAQFCSTQKSTVHAERILDEMSARKIEISWSGYLRLNHLTPALARKMWATGMSSVDLSFTGSQEMIDALTLGYSLEQQMAAFRILKENGHRDQKIKLYMPLNAPGETSATLRKTIDCLKALYVMFGRDNVLPFLFFIGVQPGTPVERQLIERGYLKADYDPLTFNPFLIKRLLYNPPPLGPAIARAYLEAVDSIDRGSEYMGRTTMDILDRKLAAVGAESSGAAWRSRVGCVLPLRGRESLEPASPAD